MPMGNVNGKTNCRVCIDCEPMQSPSDTCFRCYGENKLMHAPRKNDFAVNAGKPPKVAPLWCPHRSITSALLIIRDKEITSPHEFAREMWPDSDGWQRRTKVGHGVHAGGGMNLAAGGFLGKLIGLGLVMFWHDFHRRGRYSLTDKGKRLLRCEV